MPLELAARVPAVDIIHGVRIVDDYRWLEERDTVETEAWLRQQRLRLAQYLDSFHELSCITRRVREHLDVELLDQVCRAGQYEFYRRRLRGQEQHSIYVRDRGTAQQRLLVDPSRISPLASVDIYRVSSDGAMLAYSVRYGGSDKSSIRFIEVESGIELSEALQEGYPRGLVFCADGRGFYYCHEASSSASEHTILFRSIHGCNNDEVVYRAAKTPLSRLVLSGSEVRIGATLFHQACGKAWCDLSTALVKPQLEWTCVFQNSELPSYPLLHRERLFVVRNTTQGQSVVVELARDGSQLSVVVPPRPSAIRQVAIANDRIYVSYSEAGRSAIYMRSLTGEDLGMLEVPSGGSVQLIGNQITCENHVFYTYEGTRQPSVFLEYEPDKGSSILWSQQAPAKDQKQLFVREHRYLSRDGTEVSLTLSSLGFKEGGSPAPTLLTSYGGFGISSGPEYSILANIMMELGAIFAVAHIRGGGEGGASWHEAGRGRKRQNAFDDFLAAAEWLCDRRVTSPSRLGILGGSNSGLLVAAAMIQRPDLFRAVVCIAPLLDMLRYERFDRAVRWRKEYGSVDDYEDFLALHGYSPYHRVKAEVNYPPTLFVSGDRDDRCNPAHVRKMAALLQNRSAQANPILVDYERERGHYPALNVSSRTAGLSRRLAFLCRELGVTIPELEER